MFLVDYEFFDDIRDDESAAADTFRAKHAIFPIVYLGAELWLIFIEVVHENGITCVASRLGVGPVRDRRSVDGLG